MQARAARPKGWKPWGRRAAVAEVEALERALLAKIERVKGQIRDLHGVDKLVGRPAASFLQVCARARQCTRTRPSPFPQAFDEKFAAVTARTRDAIRHADVACLCCGVQLSATSRPERCQYAAQRAPAVADAPATIAPAPIG